MDSAMSGIWYSLVPSSDGLVDGFLHVLTHLSGNRDEGEIGLWVESERFEERGDLVSDLVKPACQHRPPCTTGRHTSPEPIGR